MKIAIVGTGWYGCYIAEYILDNFKNVEITMYDKNKDFFTGSSYYNQNRLHLGYHYSRSFKTRHLCKETFKLFKEKYYQLIDEVNKNYYIVSKESIIDFGTYNSIYQNEKYNFTTLNNNFTNCDGKIINVDEMHINFEKSKKYFQEKLKEINVVLGFFVHSIDNVKNKVLINGVYEFDKVFNCTYNQFKLDPQECLYEKCLSLLYKKVGETSFDTLTIMDGEFSSIYKYADDIYTLTNVKYTPVFTSISYEDVEQYEIHNIRDKIKLFEQDILKYYPQFKDNFKYHGYYTSYKCKNISNSDSRHLNILVDDNIFSIWCGKISLVCKVDKDIDGFLS